MKSTPFLLLLLSTFIWRTSSSLSPLSFLTQPSNSNTKPSRNSHAFLTQARSRSQFQSQLRVRSGASGDEDEGSDDASSLDDNDNENDNENENDDYDNEEKDENAQLPDSDSDETTLQPSTPPSSKAETSTPSPSASTTQSASSYLTKTTTLKSTLLTSTLPKILTLTTSKYNSALSKSLNALLDGVLKKFSTECVPPSGEVQIEIYDRALEEVERFVGLQVLSVSLNQMSNARELALTQYKNGISDGSVSEFEAHSSAVEYYKTCGYESYSGSHDVNRINDLSLFVSSLQILTSTNKQLNALTSKSQQTQTQTLAFLHTQQQQLQQLQQQLYGTTSPFSLALAYRLPNTNLNLSGSHSQGKSTIQVSCVPDEYAGMLGGQGFSNGVGPGNVGVSFNFSV